MDQTILQYLLALAMLITTAASGLGSLKIMRLLTDKAGETSKTGAKWLSLLSCFSGGVFLATCFLDIIPHIVDNYAVYRHASGVVTTFPIPYTIICVGFFIVYMMEEACIWVFSMKHDDTYIGIPEEAKRSPDPLLDVEKGTPFVAERDVMLCDGISRASIHDHVVEESVKYMTSTTDEASFLKSITFAVAMSFHSILEGFALGVQEDTSAIVTLFVSLLLHKAIEAFGVGLQVSRGNTKRLKIVISTILVYALMTPIGSIIGTILQNSSLESSVKILLVVIFESLAAGTFIYVTFLEVLAHEKFNDVNAMKQLVSIFAGFMVITTLQFIMSNMPTEDDVASLSTVQPLSTAA